MSTSIIVTSPSLGLRRAPWGARRCGERKGVGALELGLGSRPDLAWTPGTHYLAILGHVAPELVSEPRFLHPQSGLIGP